ncbi:hypothetical protein LINPERPRIM_LOCUS25198, partial [Linum perenne]
ENTTKKGRGKNKCKAIAKLRAGEKLSIKFFQRRGVGMHGDVWARKLGLVYRDPSIIPVQIKKWKEHFDSPDINEYRVDTLVHMKSLWSKWRSKLYTHYVGKHSQEDALKNVPPMMKKEDWVWLVHDHFFSGEYKVEEFGEEPDLVKIFNYVYAQDGVVKDPAALEKLKKCLESKNHGNVVCLGGGVKAKDFTQKSSKKAELINKLRRSEEEKEILRNDAEKQKQRMNEVEAEMVNVRAQMQALINAQQAGWFDLGFVVLLT